MCVMSALHDYGTFINPDVWRIPGVVDDWSDLIKSAEDFDKKAEQPHCEDPEKVASLKKLQELAELLKRPFDVPAAAASDPMQVKLEETQKRLAEALERNLELKAQRAELLIEKDSALVTIERLQAEVVELTAQADGEAEWNAAASERNRIYTERNRVVALAARMAKDRGLDVAVALEADAPGWMVVYIELPTGQVSWHFPAADSAYFDGLPFGARAYDGHTTQKKYERVDSAYSKKQAGVRELLLGGVGGGVKLDMGLIRAVPHDKDNGVKLDMGLFGAAPAGPIPHGAA